MKHRFSAAVAGLLFEIGANRAAAMVPDLSGRGEADFFPGVEQSPADVNIIAGLAEARIEAAYVEQCLAAERHVAAGDVLGIAVVEHDVGG